MLVKGSTFSVIKRIHPEGMMCSMVTIVNNTVCIFENCKE